MPVSARASAAASFALICAGFLHVPLNAEQQYSQLRLIAPAAPGGGWDQTARVMQQVLQQTGLAGLAPVENIPGAAGTIGLSRFVNSERGRGDTLLVSGLIMLGAIVTHASPVTLSQVTPIARLTAEYEVIVVPSASPYRSLRALLDAFRERPESISWGGGSAGGTDQILAGLVADAIGVSPRRVNYIAYSGGGEAMSAILGGQVSAGINGLAEFAAQIEAGTVRVLAISSAERLPGLDAPTLREQGVDIEFENWRCVMAAPGISDEERRQAEQTIAAMVRSQPWRAALERYRWMDRHLDGDAFEQFLTSEEQRVHDILDKLGLGQRAESTRRSTNPYPLAVIAGLICCGLAALRGGRPSRGASPASAGAAGGITAVALIAAGIALDLVLMEILGFVLASASLFWLTSRAFDPTRPWRDAAFAVGASLGAYVLFVRLLKLTLPSGIFGGWL
ncbi:MAG: tripartite tricarboxylate transporter substrate-binding protein [Vicinamibacterales bacterium]